MIWRGLMSDIIDKLMAFGFTKTDALVYINLIKSGRSSGYKIAKDIGLSRSTVYSSIDRLYAEGYVFMVDGTTKEYEAKSPDLIFEKIEKQTLKNIDYLKKELTVLMAEEDNEFIFNVSGYDNLVQKAKETIEKAQTEIYLNTDFNMVIFKDELDRAIDRGVRVIAFSFKKIVPVNDKIEVYSRFDQDDTELQSTRFMIVVDLTEALIFSNQKSAVGIYTNNNLIVNITTEHIHNDIYLSWHEKNNDILDDSSKWINSIHEKTNGMTLLSMIGAQ